MKDFLETKESLIAQLHSNAESGLTTQQVAENAAKYGTNSFTREKPPSLLHRIMSACAEPMILLLIAAGAIALVVDLIHWLYMGYPPNFFESVGVFFAIALSVVITVVMEGRSAKAFEALSRLNEDVVVKAIRDGQTVTLNRAEIVVGDILLIATGDAILVDGRLLECTSIATDEAALTGESLPVTKNADSNLNDEKTPLAERINMLYSGTYVTNGFGKMLVTAVGDGTEFGKIARALTAMDSGSTPLQEKLRRLGTRVTYLGVSAAALVFIVQMIGFARDGGIQLAAAAEAFVASIVLIVASVPEGLPTIVAVSLAINVIKMAKENALVKKMIACETVGCVNIICSDKTGTLTENKMTVVNEITSSRMFENICINSTADLGEDGKFIGNSTECATLAAVKSADFDYKQIRRDANVVHVIPFTSVKKGMTTLVRNNDGFCAYFKGSPEKVLDACAMTDTERAEAEAQIMSFQEKACRVIGFAHRNFSIEPAMAFGITIRAPIT